MSAVVAAPARFRFEAIGTAWEIDTAEPLTAALRADVLALVERFDRAWSRFRDDSVVTRLSEEAGEARLPDAASLLDVYAALAEATDDAVNPLVGEALARRGYDAGYSLRDAGPTAAPDWRGILSWDAEGLRLDRPALLDIGAIGKGRLVDLVHALVAGAVQGPVTVDASGDVRMRGVERIALEHPYDPRRAIGVWQVADAALCASAITRRAWGDGLHHVLDARTGEPVRAVVATWAVAASAMLADAAATALFFDGGPRHAHEHGIQWVRMTSAGAVEWSPGCSAELVRATVPAR